jgi:hypothetical protein
VTLPQPPRRTNYVGSGNDLDWVRGRGIYEEAANLLPELVRCGDRLVLESDRCGLYVVRMPVVSGIVLTLERLAAETCGCRVIVDVCADLWTEGAELTAEDPRWWRTVARPLLERAVRVADLVTVPHPGLVDPVLALNPRVAVVPDCPDGVSTTEAMLAWTHATAIACRRDREEKS